MTSAFFATSATLLLGFAGLAADGGVWYLSLRNATSAADLAALAGAAALDRGGDARAAAAGVALRNGFGAPQNAAVTVNIPPTVSTGFRGAGGAVEVLIAQPQRAILAGLFLDSIPTVRTRAVATATTTEKVCLLALGGGLDLGGNSTANSVNCAIASNAPAPGGLYVVGSARVRTASLVTTGVCSGCGGGDVWADPANSIRPAVTANRPDPVPDPFGALRNWTPAPASSCKAPPAYSGRAAKITPGTFCGLSVGSNETLTLEPGLYYVKGGDLTVQGTINGNGVTIVMTGEPDNIGTIRINAQASGDLRGPSTSLIPGQPSAAGLVLYRDARATNNGPAKEVQLNGGASMDIYGGIYLPTSDVVINGRSSMGSNCFSIVGYRLSLSGSSDTTVDVSGCPGVTPYPVIRTVRLVE